MNIVVRGKNIEISETMRNYVTKKLSKLERFFDRLMDATVNFTLERGRIKVESTLTASGIVIRGEAVGSDWRSALDEVMDKLERQVKRYKERLGKRGVLRKEAVVEFEREEVEEPALPPVDKVARVKEFVLRPMSIEDAILQMELLGHTFFIFKDLDKDKVQVVYKREDGNYGLIDPIY
ncbi:MAG TPA: ribosome-associated translation inhibitor RaiA [Candidatus Atribacteria bacterium]|nr:ribosome-associated translation inhibitor RaiA [Candidatus Atribacteria bacterium]